MSLDINNQGTVVVRAVTTSMLEAQLIRLYLINQQAADVWIWRQEIISALTFSIVFNTFNISLLLCSFRAMGGVWKLAHSVYSTRTQTQTAISGTWHTHPPPFSAGLLKPQHPSSSCCCCTPCIITREMGGGWEVEEERKGGWANEGQVEEGKVD